MIPKPILDFAEICARKGVEEAVLSPGSRCAPLAIAFARHPGITARSVGDERSAAFIALGMALQTKKPSVLVCTSGSAVYNYAPAIAEAYFQQVPLLILTADRPPEWIHQMDGQTIVQHGIYGHHVKKSYETPVDLSSPDAQWHAQRILSEAINLSNSFPCGPVHVNVPIREPFYPTENQEIIFDPEVKVIDQSPQSGELSPAQQESLWNEWQHYEKKMVLSGQQPLDTALAKLIGHTAEHHRIPIIGDIISNLHPLENSISHQDLFLNLHDEALMERLKPDLLITFGKSIISKNLKLMLRKHKPTAHWHLQVAGPVADTFQSLTRHIKCSPSSFFHLLSNPENKGDHHQAQDNFLRQWQAEEEKSEKLLKGFFPQTVLGEFEAFKIVMEQLPSPSQLHLANSMAVRYANFLGLKGRVGIEVFANRGTSGIDGSNSTALGAALKTEKPVFLLTGDMAFFYDRNAFWHRYLPPNLHIIVFNNHGGGIFQMIPGPGRLPEFKEYFQTEQPLNAKSTALEFGFEYSQCSQRDQLEECIQAFLETGDKRHRPKILEIETDADHNSALLKRLRSHFSKKTP